MMAMMDEFADELKPKLQEFMRVIKNTLGAGYHLEDGEFEEKFREWATSWDSS